MRSLLKSQSGFTFVETLISFSIVGIFLALTWATVDFLLIKTNDQIVKTRGHFLAVEGIEIVKQIVQTSVNQNREFGFMMSIGNLNDEFIINKSGDYFSLVKASNEEIDFNEEPYTTYCRTIKISGEKNTKTVESKVKWGAPRCSDGDKEIVYTTLISNKEI